MPTPEFPIRRIFIILSLDMGRLTTSFRFRRICSWFYINLYKSGVMDVVNRDYDGNDWTVEKQKRRDVFCNILYGLA